MVKLGWATLPATGINTDSLAVLEVSSMAERHLAIAITNLAFLELQSADCTDKWNKIEKLHN